MDARGITGRYNLSFTNGIIHIRILVCSGLHGIKKRLPVIGFSDMLGIHVELERIYNKTF